MDIKAAKARITAPPPDLDQKLHDVAKMYEKQFVNEMMRAMKQTVAHSDLTKPSMAERIYTDEMYDQYAEQWVETGGNGLADQIYKELKEKILPSQHGRYVQPAEPASPEKKTDKKID